MPRLSEEIPLPTSGLDCKGTFLLKILKSSKRFHFPLFLENCNNFSLSCSMGVIKRANYRILFAVFSNNATKGCLCTNAMISSKCYSTPVTEES